MSRDRRASERSMAWLLWRTAGLLLSEPRCVPWSHWAASSPSTTFVIFAEAVAKGGHRRFAALVPNWEDADKAVTLSNSLDERQRVPK